MAERLWIYGEENGHRQLSALLLYLAVQWGRDEERLAPSKTTGTVRHSTAFTTLPAPALERSLPFASPPDHPWAGSISLPCLRNRFLSNINTSFLSTISTPCKIFHMGSVRLPFFITTTNFKT